MFAVAARPFFYWRVTMASSATIQRLEQRAQMADEMIAKLKEQVGQLNVQAQLQESQKLITENNQLSQQVERLRQTLVNLEIRNGVKQVSLPASLVKASTTDDITPPPQVNNVQAEEKPAQTKDNKNEWKAAKKEKKEKKPKQPATPAAIVEVTVSALDLRIGRINNVKKHPDADTLYVEEVDCGEEAPRTVVSGLVKQIPMEQMQDRLIIVCCNLKPSKMRGVVSQAMVMCASSPEKVEILDPPAGAQIGDRISFQGYPLSETFPPQMNPKKKIFEQIQPHLKTDDSGVATYKGVPFEIQGKGVCKSQSMTNSIIK